VEKQGNVCTTTLEKEMVTLFTNILKFLYYEHMMGSSTQHFYDVVVIAERIEYPFVAY
jgi:hypothetical protein